MSHEEMVNIMEYTIREIKDGVATVDYTDGSWAQIPMKADMTKPQFEQRVIEFGPKPQAAPSWAQTGTFTATKSIEPIVTAEGPHPEWMNLRIVAYGDPAAQLEFITEYGLEAWRAHVEAVKALYPKEGE